MALQCHFGLEEYDRGGFLLLKNMECTSFLPASSSHGIGLISVDAPTFHEFNGPINEHYTEKNIKREIAFSEII